jgi:hypothetical protein
MTMRPPQDTKPRLTVLSGLSGELLLTMANTVFLGFEFCGSHDHILLPHALESAGEDQQQFI